MKAEPYKNYKPANAVWLGALPETWDQIRGRFVMAVNPPARRARALDEADEVSFVPMEAVGEYGGLDLERTKPLDEVGAGYTAFEDGDVVVAKITPCFENGKGAIARALKNGVGFGTTELHVLRVGKRLDQQFLFYLTISHTFRMLGESEMYGAGGQKRVPPEFAKDFRIPLPPLDEQQTIARFLDAKTAQIDALVAHKRQLIAKLKEKRSALIARTVTRGLPPEAAKAAGLEPNPEMKDSGVEWIGDIPSTWKIERLRRVCRRVTDGAHISPDLSSDDFPFVSTVDIANGKIDMKNCLRTSVECYEYLVRTGCKPFPGDVLFSKDGTVGKTAVVEFSADFVVASSLVIISPNSRHLNFHFLDYWLNNDLLKQEVTLQMAGAALRRISVEKVGRLPVLLPPLNEQKAIVLYLDGEALQLDALITKAEAAIDRLTEYRQALITSAVTGKIDVRDWQAELEAA